MKDSEVLEAIGAHHEDRVLEAYRRMAEHGADEDRIAQVLEGVLESSIKGASVDGEATALRQLDELGVTYYERDLRRTSRKTSALREAAEEVGRERERLVKAIRTVMESTSVEQLEHRLARLVFSETVTAARRNSARIMRRTNIVAGWTRQLDSDPCELCRWWSRDGRVWPVEHTMPTHPGCACAQAWTALPSISIRMVSSRGEMDSMRRREAGTLEERRKMGEGTWSTRSKRGVSD